MAFEIDKPHYLAMVDKQGESPKTHLISSIECIPAGCGNSATSGNARIFAVLPCFKFADGRKREILTLLLKIISGGQTGVDRGALDAALQFGLECGGWCPAGRLAEDGIIPEHYPVMELTGGGYAARTAQNVADSDGTLIISNREPIGGTSETLERCLEMQKPYLVIDCRIVRADPATDLALEFVSQLSSRANASDAAKYGTANEQPRDSSPCARLGMTTILNVAGPRASQWPEGHALTYQIMSAILRRISGQNDAN